MVPVLWGPEIVQLLSCDKQSSGRISVSTNISNSQSPSFSCRAWRCRGHQALWQQRHCRATSYTGRTTSLGIHKHHLRHGRNNFYFPLYWLFNRVVYYNPHKIGKYYPHIPETTMFFSLTTSDHLTGSTSSERFVPSLRARGRRARFRRGNWLVKCRSEVVNSKGTGLPKQRATKVVMLFEVQKYGNASNKRSRESARQHLCSSFNTLTAQVRQYHVNLHDNQRSLSFFQPKQCTLKGESHKNRCVVWSPQYG